MSTGSGTSSHPFQENMRELSSRVERVQASAIQQIYGTIVGFLSDSSGDQYFKVQVRPDADQTSQSRLSYVLLGDDPDHIASNYGAPQDLVGKRVRVVYRGGAWTSGMAYLTGDIGNNRSVRERFNTRTQPFSWAPPGSGI